MRDQLKTGYMGAEDQETFLTWVNSSPKNEWDSGVLKYPTLRVICAYNGRPVSFLPVHDALVMESIAVNKDAGDLERAQALRDLTKAAELHASARGMRELYFICTDEDVLKIAKNHGFEQVEFPVLRMRLGR